MTPAFSPNSSAMLKFWKKKPPAEDKPAPVVPQEIADTHAIESPAVAELAAQIAEEVSPEVAREAAQVSPPEPDEALEAAAPPESTPSAAAKRSWRERLSGSGFARGLSSLFSRNPVLDDALLDELETCLITADVGVTAATELVERLRKRIEQARIRRCQRPARRAARRTGRAAQAGRAPAGGRRARAVRAAKPFVILVVGVNGVGKTTTIGKLARRFHDEGRSALLAAGDTFRAAAVEQLQSWGERNQVPVIAQGSGADSASVIFDALQTARSRGIDVLIADTAGRLHTQSGLMDELAKIRRVLAKLDAEAPHEVLLVIDGTTGQNAINQVRQFQQAIGVTGLVVTKLDGTAKGGVVFALAREFGLPIRYVGLGESAEDLRVFDATAFVDGLLPASLGTHA